MTDTNELIDVCTDLIRLVEGVGCKDWRDQNGQRFKDTNEWVRAYVAINNAREESREKPTPPADAALADALEHAGTRAEFHPDSEIAVLCRKAAAALRARAVPEGFALVPVTPSVEMIDAGFWAQCEATRESIKDMWAAMLAASKGEKP